MIIGLSIKYFKTYSAINYIPLSNGQNFNGVVGDNGIGKTSVLEALDCLFNNREFNLNTQAKKSGTDTANPHIVPIFLIKESSNIISTPNRELARKYSDFIWNISKGDVFPQNQNHLSLLLKQFEILERDELKTDYLILPIGINYQRKVDLSFFNTKTLTEVLEEEIVPGNKKIEQDRLEDLFRGILNDLLKYYEYVYIPNDINPATFTNLENLHVQALMGKTLTDVIATCVSKSDIKRINEKLKDFLTELDEVLVDYSFKTPTDRQKMVRKADVYNLIIEEFFKTRKLHKKTGSKWLDVSLLSSGEKRNAIIHLTQRFLNKYRKDSSNVILAIDEPESSLHVSACYDQFNSLFDISGMCSQLIFSTHWYGFIPILSGGNVTVITQKENKHLFDLVSVANYREEIKQDIDNSNGKLPHAIRLKGLNDFIQSIITSVLADKPFNWLLCEGSSEKKYFEHYFKEDIETKNLRIIPVGGATQVKRIYQHLLVTYDDFKKNVKGNIVLLIDTDSNMVEFETKNNNHQHLKCFRIVNDVKKNETTLVEVHRYPKTPKTEIEDTLCGKTFFKALKKFSGDQDIDKFIESVNSESITDKSVYYALDLSPSQQELMSKIFKKGNFKFEFAEKYIESIDEEHRIPEYIQDLKEHLFSL